MASRRDIRHFRSDPVDEALVQRLLSAAHSWNKGNGGQSKAHASSSS